MIVVTTSEISGTKIVKTLGLVKGNTIRVRHVGSDIVAGLRSLVGGEIPEYTKMMAGAREQALDRMIADAQSMGANAVVEMRVTTSTVMKGAAEIVCYGTAVIVQSDNG